MHQSRVRYSMPAPSILTICVNYNNDKETQQFVSELLIQKGDFSQKVIVVDNSESPSLDSPLYSLFKSDSRVLIINSGKNLGYFGGAALGFREYSKEFPLPDWVIVCNTDIDLIQPDFLSKLCNFHAVNPPAVIAPSVYSTLSKVNQNPNMQHRPTVARMHFYKWISRYHPTFVAYQTLALAKQKLLAVTHRNPVVTDGDAVENRRQPAPRAIYAAHGSFIVFHRSYFEAGGNLDHGAFLFGEEVFVAETIRRLGLTAIYDPRLVVLHREHAATGVLKNQKRFLYVREATAYCADNFFRTL